MSEAYEMKSANIRRYLDIFEQCQKDCAACPLRTGMQDAVLNEPGLYLPICWAFHVIEQTEVREPVVAARLVKIDNGVPD